MSDTEARDKLMELRRIIKKQTNTIVMLERAAVKKADYAELKSTIKQQLAIIDDYKQKKDYHDEQKNTIGRMNGEIHHLTETIRGDRDVIGNLKNNIKKLEAQLFEKSCQIKRLQTWAVNDEAAHRQVCVKLDDAEKKNELCVIEKLALQGKIDELQSKIDELQIVVNKDTATIESLNEQLKDESIKRVCAKMELDARSGEDVVKEKVSRDKFTKKIDELTEKIDELTDTNVKLENQNSYADETIEGLNARLRVRSSEIKTMKKGAKFDHDTIQHHLETIAVLKKHIEESETLDEKIDEFEIVNETVESLETSKTAEESETSKTVESLETVNETAEESETVNETAEESETVNETAEESVNETSDIEALQAKLATAEKNCDNLNTVVKQLRVCDAESVQRIDELNDLVGILIDRIIATDDGFAGVLCKHIAKVYL